MMKKGAKKALNKDNKKRSIQMSLASKFSDFYVTHKQGRISNFISARNNYSQNKKISIVKFMDVEN